MTNSPFRCPVAYEILKTVMEVGLRIVQQAEAHDKFIAPHYDFPEYTEFESGLPHISRIGSDKSPKDYGSVFKKELSPTEIPEWEPFFKLAESNELLKKYYRGKLSYILDVPGADELRETLIKTSIELTIEKFIDRYIHLAGKKEFDEKAFEPLYRAWENAAFSENIQFDIFIPLLMVTFNFAEYKVNDFVSIVKMSEPFQLARCRDRHFPIVANECVVSAATHALVLYGWEMPNAPGYARADKLTNVENFREVIDQIDQFFSVFRAVTGHQTGYGQLVISPDGWCDGGIAYLPQLLTIGLRAFPDHFEQYGWLTKPPVIEEEQCNEIAMLFSALRTQKRNELHVAARRLNLAFLRSSEQDSIIDVAIGLETLLVGDGAQGEINHKLAMRLASLCKIRPFASLIPQDIFRVCKKLYEFRSAVAHGSTEIKTKRIIKIDGGSQPQEAVILGTNLLRHVLKFMIEKPEYIEPKALDMALLNVTSGSGSVQSASTLPSV